MQFAPTVLIDGQTVTPPGWMWVMAFALRGIPWAVEAALKPEFDATVKAWLREQEILELEEQERNLLAQLEEVRKKKGET